MYTFYFYSKDYRDAKPSTSVMNSGNSTCTFISKRSRIDEMGTKEQQMQKEESVLPNDANVPTIKLCLRLPNGSKETISMMGSDTVEVNFIKNMLAFPCLEINLCFYRCRLL